MYPLDTIKTRLQSRDFLKTYGSAGVKKVDPNFFRGLYQGVGSVIIATLPACASHILLWLGSLTNLLEAGVFFTTYEATKRFYTTLLPSSTPQPIVHAAASGTSELASCLVLTPAEVIKQNAQMLSRSGANHGSTSLEALRMLRHAEGGPARRLWSGYTALAARNLPFTAMQFPMFEFFRGKLWDWRAKKKGIEQRTRHAKDGEDLQEKIQAKEAGDKSMTSMMFETGWVNALSAGSSGAIAAVITTPSDVVKTRMMLVDEREGEGRTKSATGGLAESENRRRRGGLDVAKHVLRENGVKGLFRGGALRAVWTFIGSGLYLGTYEVAKVWLKGGRDLDDDSF